MSSRFGVQISGPSILIPWERYHRENRKSTRKPDPDTSQKNTWKKRRCHALFFHVHTPHAQFLLLFPVQTHILKILKFHFKHMSRNFVRKYFSCLLFRKRNVGSTFSSLCRVHTFIHESRPNCFFHMLASSMISTKNRIITCMFRACQNKISTNIDNISNFPREIV